MLTRDNLSVIYKIPASILLVTMVVYYYLYFLSPKLTVFLPYLALGGIILSGILIVGILLNGRVPRRTMAYIILFLMIMAFSAVLQWPNLAWITMTSSALLALKRNEFIKIFFYASLALFIVIVSLAYTGHLPMVHIGFDGMESERYGAIKYSFGFDGPNQAAMSFFSILLAGMYLYGHKGYFVIVALLASLTIGLGTGSRTGLIVSLLFTIIYYIAIGRARTRSKQRPRPILRYLFPLLFVLSYSIAMLLAHSPAANEVLSSRPSLMESYLTDANYTPSIAGTDRVYNKAIYQTPPIDNFFIYIYARYGIMGFLMFLYIFWRGFKNESSLRIQIVFVFILLYGMFEAFFDIPAKNFIMPILIMAMFRKEI